MEQIHRHDKLLYPVFKLIHKPDGCLCFRSSEFMQENEIKTKKKIKKIKSKKNALI